METFENLNQILQRYLPKEYLAQQYATALLEEIKNYGEKMLLSIDDFLPRARKMVKNGIAPTNFLIKDITEKFREDIAICS